MERDYRYSTNRDPYYIYKERKYLVRRLKKKKQIIQKNITNNPFERQIRIVPIAHDQEQKILKSEIPFFLGGNLELGKTGKKKEVFTYMTPKLKTIVVEGDDKILKGCETHGENITFSFASLTQPRI